MKVIQTVGLAVLLLFAGVYLVGHRYQLTATNQTLFVMDHLTGNISAYLIGPEDQQIDVMKVHLIATTQ